MNPTFWLLIPGLFIPVWLLILLVVSWASGWSTLGQRYRATEMPQGEKFRMQFASFGWLDYNGCLTIVVAPDGIYLALWWMFRFAHPALLLPWSSLHVEKIKATGWVKQVTIHVDDPPVARVKLPLRILDAAQRLRPDLTGTFLTPHNP
jgi:hypothetical protein